jgi:lipoprotein-releasing system ATP-binding protein
MSLQRFNDSMINELCLSCRDIERFLGEEEERVHALRGVSLDLEPGSIHAVVGPSGCGKSTLLYILGLLDQPDAGQVSIAAAPMAHLNDDELAHKRNEFIGFIFQFHFLMEDFTAEENVMIPMRKLARLSEEQMRSRAGDLLEAVGLGDKLRRPSRHLSGGEQQRVAIARALANDPRVILADEPTGNLDTANSERAFELLQKIVQQGEKALLLATHNIDIAEACDWIHEMKDGRVVASHPRGGRSGSYGS